MLSAITYLTLGALLARVQEKAGASGLPHGARHLHDPAGRREPRLSRRSLAERRAGRLGRRRRLGRAVLVRGAAIATTRPGGKPGRDLASIRANAEMRDREKPARKLPRKVTPAYLQRAASPISNVMPPRPTIAPGPDPQGRQSLPPSRRRPAEFHDMIDEVVAKSLRSRPHRRRALCRGPGRHPATPGRLGAGDPGEIFRQGRRPPHHRGGLEGEDGDEEKAARAFARTPQARPLPAGRASRLSRQGYRRHGTGRLRLCSRPASDCRRG